MEAIAVRPTDFPDVAFHVSSAENGGQFAAIRHAMSRCRRMCFLQPGANDLHLSLDDTNFAALKGKP
jgi:hypothetical protein